MTCKKYIHTIVVCLEKNRIFSPFKKNIIIEYLYFKHISSISVWDPKDPDQIALKIKEWHEVSLFFSKQNVMVVWPYKKDNRSTTKVQICCEQ